MVEQQATGFKAETSAGNSQLILLGSNAAQLGLSLLITIILGRFLDPESFGFFSLVSALFVVGRELNDMGTGSVAAREIVQKPAEEEGILSALLGLRRLVALGLAVVCVTFTLKAENSLQALVFLASGLVMVSLYHSAFYVVFQVRQAFLPLMKLSISVQVFMLGACLGIIFMKVAGIFVAMLVLIREYVMLFGTRLLALRFLRQAPRARLRAGRFKDFYRKAFTFGLATVFYHLAVHGGTFFTWFFGTNLEVGAYSAAFRLIYPLMTLPWILMVPILPVYSQLAENEGKAFSGQIGANFRLLLGIGLVIAVAGYFLAPSVLRFLYGDNFITGTVSAVDTFQWLSVALCFASVIPALAISLLSAGREHILMRLAGVALVVNIVSNMLLVPAFSYTGAAISLALAECAFFLGLLVVVLRTIGGAPLRKHIFPFLLPSICLSAALLLLPESLFPRVFMGTLLTLFALLIVWTLPSARRMRDELALLGERYGKWKG